MSTHEEHEDYAWTIAVGNHPKRTESPTYNRSRRLMIKAVQEASQARPWYFGEPPYQDHHGGGVWVKPTDGAPLMYLLPAGIEWSAQFCADPAKVDVLRAWAEAIVAAFTDSERWYTEDLGMSADDLAILHTPITNADQVAAWTDSFWNASVPLPVALHTGVRPKGSGFHHYPKPIVDIMLFKRDDFDLFVEDGHGNEVAVVPVAPRGSGVSDVEVVYASPASPLEQAHHEAHQAGERLILPGDSHLAAQAFSEQDDTHDEDPTA